MVTSYGGYATNQPLTELRGGKAWIVYRYGEYVRAAAAYPTITRVVSNATYPVKSCPTVSIADRLGCG